MSARAIRWGMGAALALTCAAGLPIDRAFAQGQVLEQQNSCFRCHRVIDDRRYSDPVREYVGDIHFEKGLGCVVCHGGDSTILDRRQAKDRTKGYIGAPSEQDIPQLCGRCHSDARFMKRYNPSPRIDQVAEYATSVHGQRLFELGDDRVATCTSCHTAHSIRPPSDPTSSVHPLRVAETCGNCHADTTYMSEYDIPQDQLSEYRTSVHWKAMDEDGDLSAPTCNDCHGNHGAAPPEVEWIGNVCGQCHVVQQGLFESSLHPAALMSLGKPGCIGCHDNHAIHETSDEMLGTGSRSVCVECHEPDEPEGRAAAGMLAMIEQLKVERARSDSLLERAEGAGLEVSQARFELEDATNAIVLARASTHSASEDSVRAQVEAGLAITSKAWESGKGAFRDLRIRRIGLAVSSLIIVILIAGIVMKIREFEARQGPEAGVDDTDGGSRHG
ncbi:MAG TPA: cytochrome c3 family protein [Gemmatimonadota bacterium]|nr:cytochrome c3 family protein [Gemmatimonadota bacterium]